MRKLNLFNLEDEKFIYFLVLGINFQSKLNFTFIIHTMQFSCKAWRSCKLNVPTLVLLMHWLSVLSVQTRTWSRGCLVWGSTQQPARCIPDQNIQTKSQRAERRVCLRKGKRVKKSRSESWEKPFKTKTGNLYMLKRIESTHYLSILCESRRRRSFRRMMSTRWCGYKTTLQNNVL